MAAHKSTLNVIFSRAAIDELAEIWQWNAEYYSSAHADAYLAFLRKAIDRLSSRYASGRALSARPDLHYILIRRKPRGHGHIAVYTFDDKQVSILHVFHTAQDWRATLSKRTVRE